MYTTQRLEWVSCRSRCLQCYNKRNKGQYNQKMNSDFECHKF